MNAIGKAIAAYRRSTGITLQEFSFRVGMTPSVLSNLQTGKHWPSLPALRDLAKFLGWTPEEIGEFVLSARPPKCGPRTQRRVKSEQQEVKRAEDVGASAA